MPGNRSDRTAAMSERRQVWAATLSRSPAVVHPLRGVLLRRSAVRRKARMPSSSTSALIGGGKG